jgi:hypothetical protein
MSLNTEDRPERFPPCTFHVMETVHRKKYCRMFGTGEPGNVKDEMPDGVQQWTLDALVEKKSLHFDCWKTTDANRLQHGVPCVGSCTISAALCVY